MKALLLAAVVAITSLMPVVGCAGPKARTHVLVPAIQQAAGGVEADARAGLERMDEGIRSGFRTDIDGFFGAIHGNDEQAIREATAAHWTRVQEAATVGIDHKLATGAIGPNTAVLLRERLLQFDERLRQLNPPVRRTP